jgi:hypothetical protein
MFASQLVQESQVPLPKTSAFSTTLWNSMLSLLIRLQRVVTSFRVTPRTWMKIFRCFGRRYIYCFQGEPEVIAGALRPGTHYPHVTWAHVMLRLQLGCERRFAIEFYGADSPSCHSAYVTWSHVPARLSHFCCRTQFVRWAHVTWG